MQLLRRVLYLQAALAALGGLVLVFLPGLVVSIFNLTPSAESAWIRLMGIQSLTLAMLAVLIAQAIEEKWWWTWAFVFGNTAVATFTILKGALGLTSASSRWFWIAYGAGHAVLALLELAGIGRTGQERVPG